MMAVFLATIMEFQRGLPENSWWVLAKNISRKDAKSQRERKEKAQQIRYGN